MLILQKRRRITKHAIIRLLIHEVISMQDAQNATEVLIREQIAKHAVLLYMKGTPQFPQCGFSARAVEVLSQIGRPFAYVNILENPDIRATLPRIANWPTFPQLWVAGELIGGSDILLQMFQSGELRPLIEDHSPAQ
jgi:monothiol glutaredoxin